MKEKTKKPKTPKNIEDFSLRELGAIFRKERERRRITQGEVAKRIGKSKTAVVYYEECFLMIMGIYVVSDKFSLWTILGGIFFFANHPTTEKFGVGPCQIRTIVAFLVGKLFIHPRKTPLQYRSNTQSLLPWFHK